MSQFPYKIRNNDLSNSILNNLKKISNLFFLFEKFRTQLGTQIIRPPIRLRISRPDHCFISIKKNLKT